MTSSMLWEKVAVCTCSKNSNKWGSNKNGKPWSNNQQMNMQGSSSQYNNNYNQQQNMNQWANQEQNMNQWMSQQQNYYNSMQNQFQFQNMMMEQYKENSTEKNDMANEVFDILMTFSDRNRKFSIDQLIGNEMLASFMNEEMSEIDEENEQIIKNILINLQRDPDTKEKMKYFHSSAKLAWKDDSIRNGSFLDLMQTLKENVPEYRTLDTKIIENYGHILNNSPFAKLRVQKRSGMKQQTGSISIELNLCYQL